MNDFSDTSDAMGVCAVCGGSLAAARYVQAAGRALRTFCSQACLRTAARVRRVVRRAALIRLARRLTIGGVFMFAGLAPLRWPARPARVDRMIVAPSTDARSTNTLRAGWFGPEWPPTETSLLAALGRDAWIHPLAGPVRRMPRADSRVFGAARPGNRAVECRNGHCGVDLGGEIWGEQVRAAHDGVVDRVQRAANPDHGGRYVRIAHHDGTVFTMYFHLAAIPRGLERGVRVKAGQVVGLLGDTGVKSSAPHLHFSVSIKLSDERPEKYIDPEPLIALWPVRVPVDGTEVGLVNITAPPGVPLGSAPLLSARARKLAKQKKGGGPDVEAPEPTANEPGESTDETAAPEPTAETAEPSAEE